MKVAIAGTGNVAKYLFDELPKAGHDVVVLTRSAKSAVTLPQRETDYSVDSLVSILADRDALISTITDYTNIPRTTELHLNMLAAVERSPTCKTFLPSEFTLNAEDYPEQPIPLAEHQSALHAALKGASPDLRWTIISTSWFADYILPATQRHLPDLGSAWAMDHAAKTFTIYGPGTQVFDMVSVRDVARAVGALLNSDAKWEPYTYLSGQQLSWNELFEIVRGRDAEWTAKTKPLAETVAHLRSGVPEEEFVGFFEILTYSGGSLLPRERVLRDRERHFQGVKFRNVKEILDDAAKAGEGEIV